MLGGVGYFATGYWHLGWWHEDYWVEQGAAPSATGRAIAMAGLFVSAAPVAGVVETRQDEPGIFRSAEGAAGLL